MTFKYLEPNTIDEATAIMSQYKKEAMIYAGGTSLVPRLRKRLIKPKYVVNLRKIDQLDYIHVDEKTGIRIGSLASLRSVEKSKRLNRTFEMISKTASQIACTSIRNVATVGGNICNASPWSDMVPILTALSAKIKLISTSGERLLTIGNILPGFGSAILKPDEIMIEIQAPILPSHTSGTYLKCTTKGRNTPCLASVAVVGTLDSGNRIFKDVRIIIGGVQPSVFRAPNAENFLKEKPINNKLIERVATIASNELQPPDHIYGSAEYRKEMIRIYTREAIKLTIERAKQAI